MKRMLFYCTFLFIIAACQASPTEDNRISGMAPSIEKADCLFKENDLIHPIHTNDDLSHVVSWYDDESILYIEKEEEKINIKKHHLKTGENSVFYQSDEHILEVISNKDGSLFGIQTINEKDEVNLLFVDHLGQEVMSMNDQAESYSIYWSPYNKGELIAVSYLPDWENEVFYIDIQSKNMTQIDVNETYIQWISEGKIAYLKEEIDLTFHAPLYEYDIHKEEEKFLFDHVISFIGLAEQMFITSTAESEYDIHSNYQFYKNGELYEQLEMPILNTYSNYWWTPFFTYDQTNDVFYFLRPKYSADFFSYEDDYELVAFHLEDGVEDILIELEDHEQLAISPNGDYLLIGNELSQLFQIKTNEILNLVKK